MRAGTSSCGANRSSSTWRASWRDLDPTGRSSPFEFDCGFAGWLGYELKAECGGHAAHESPLPDAALVFADRMIGFDHAEGHTYLLCLVEPGGEAEAEGGLAATARQLDPPRCCPARLTGAMSDRNAPRGPPLVLRASSARTGRALPGGDRRVQAAARRRRDIRGLPDQCRPPAEDERRPSRALSRAAPGQPGAVLLLRALRRVPPRSAPRWSVSCASPATAWSRRSRSRGRAAAGKPPPRTCASPSALRGDEKNRAGEPDDRRPAAQRPRLRSARWAPCTRPP